MPLQTPQEINDGMDRAFDHDALVFDLLDTPEAQRMEYINSTGLAYKAFPGLHYPRKTHLIGAAKWAQRAYDALQDNGAGLPESYRFVLLAAAVLHDIGHGPFSHVLEGIARERHENAASDIVLGKASFVGCSRRYPATQGEPAFVERILEKYQRAKTIPRILEDYGISAGLVADIIAESPAELGLNAFLKELLDGSIFDIDKMDYLPRDSQGANVPEGQVDPMRLLDGLRILEAAGGRHLAIADTNLRDLCHFVAARKYMFAEVYTHRTVLKYESMMREAVRRAKDYFDKNEIDVSFLTDDELFGHLMRANRVSAELAYDIKYGREFLYDEAYALESSDVLSPNDARIRRLAALAAGGAETAVRDRILGIANKGRKKKIKPHEVLVRMRYPYRRPKEWKNKLDLYVYKRRKPSVFAHLRDVVDGRGPIRDSRAREVYYELCKPQTSSYLSVYTKPDAKIREEVGAAANKLFG